MIVESLKLSYIAGVGVHGTTILESNMLESVYTNLNTECSDDKAKPHGYSCKKRLPCSKVHRGFIHNFLKLKITLMFINRKFKKYDTFIE